MEEQTLKARYARECPGRFFLDAEDLPALEDWLRSQNFLAPGRRVTNAARAGEGNMNYTLRVTTDAGSFVMKQARPWVEKYPSIPAPDIRAVVEADFYQMVGQVPAVAGVMPCLLGHSPESRVLLLEDLSPATDFTSIYQSGKITSEELATLADWALALHRSFNGPDLENRFANTEMRALNHAHIFHLPLRRDTGWNLDAWTPGLSAAAALLWDDSAYIDRVTALGHIYLGEGRCLIHGDYFPGSWMRTEAGVRIIDPEFCFWGVPEFDLGVMLAHCILARLPEAQIKGWQDRYPLAYSPLVRSFAGVEVMRRLIGVAQLPLPYGLDEKIRLLELSRRMVFEL